MRNKILLIDGSCLLFRMFFGLPGRIVDLNGNPIHAVVGFVGTLLKITEIFKPSHLLVVFDTETSLSRKEIDSDYKNNRIKDWSNYPSDKNPYTQLPNIFQALNFLNWKFYEVPNVEADDIIAAYVRRCVGDDEIIIVSNDSDLMQLIGGNIKLYYPYGKRSTLYTEIEVEKKYGIKPEMIPDFKALVGDRTDNIRGVNGIGGKTARNLLVNFGKIEDILADLNNVRPEGLKMKIQSNRELLLKNLSIIRLEKDMELPYQMTDLKIANTLCKRKTMEILREINII